MKSKKNYWPHGIVASIFMIIGACIWTIQVALDNPVEMDTFFLDEYRNVDENINNIIISQHKFDNQYNVNIANKAFKIGENNIDFTITDKADQTIDNAIVELLITRPDTSKYDVKLQPLTNENGVYKFDAFSIEKEGRWQILSKIKIGDLTSFKKLEVNATN